MTKLSTNQSQLPGGLFGTVGAPRPGFDDPPIFATKSTSPLDIIKNALNPPASRVDKEPALRMPDPNDPLKRELTKGLVARRQRGGRRGTILTQGLRSVLGQSRTQDPTNTATPGL